MKCDYGCGGEGSFPMSSGKVCCSNHYNSCPAIRKKNSVGVSKAHDDGRIPGWNILAKTISLNRSSQKGKRYAEFGIPGSGNFKSALLLERGHCCENCKLATWLEKEIVLELEHVDGNKENNTKENLKLLCPNCHSQTLTWRRGTRPGWRRKRYTDDEMKEAILQSNNLGQCLKKLDLRYGSAKTIVDCMIKYKISFMGD